MTVLLVIPARYPSVRFPGKPLAELTGAGGVKQTLIERSWRAATQVEGADRVVVATDDDRIASVAAGFGAEVVLTSDQCRNGTERCAEAHATLGVDADIVVNFQGDAPLTPPWFVDDLIAGLRADASAVLATPVLRCSGSMLRDLKADRQAGRVGATTAVFGANNRALYFSKEVIPFTGDDFGEGDSPVFHHVGVYAYRPDALAAYPSWPVGPLEQLEGLEQLRFLEQGKPVTCIEVDDCGRPFWELNNPEDIPKIEGMMAQMGMP